ncbi:nuclear transport factor 2 family protein [Streptomyces sp. UG1]|uniref:nuclear transport factor 2 family protein n=1 Tax=Streptomyces sp. UG1 TaxID=3417652 RepID=UPI003CFBBD9F
MFSTESWPQTETPGPRWRTAYNKRLVAAYVNQLMVKKDLAAVDKYVGPEYHQHNPNTADGVEGLKAGLGAYFGAFPKLTVTPKRITAEGDLVAVHSHVEHWDVFQDAPETSAANDNTMF